MPRLGQGMILEVFAAAVIGGISLNGGRGGMLGAFAGVLLMSSIDAGLNLMRVSSFWIQTVRGLVILLAMFLDAQKVRLSGRKSSLGSIVLKRDMARQAPMKDGTAEL